jgi:hypothetical protein
MNWTVKYQKPKTKCIAKKTKAQRNKTAKGLQKGQGPNEKDCKLSIVKKVDHKKAETQN